MSFGSSPAVVSTSTMGSHGSGVEQARLSTFRSVLDAKPAQIRRLSSFGELSGRTVIYGGTFDPIHCGHIEAATAAKLATNAESVVFVPTHRNPLKESGPKATDQQRLNLIELAIDRFPGFYTSAIQCSESASQFSLDLLQAIKAESPTITPILLLGADQLPNLHRWGQFERLFELAEVWVVGRPGAPTQNDLPGLQELPPVIRDWLSQHWIALHVEISATEIRAALRASQQIPALDTVDFNSGAQNRCNDVTKLLPVEVLAEIRRLQMYSN